MVAGFVVLDVAAADCVTEVVVSVVGFTVVLVVVVVVSVVVVVVVTTGSLFRYTFRSFAAIPLTMS